MCFPHREDSGNLLKGDKLGSIAMNVGKWREHECRLVAILPEFHRELSQAVDVLPSTLMQGSDYAIQCPPTVALARD